MSTNSPLVLHVWWAVQNSLYRGGRQKSRQALWQVSTGSGSSDGIKLYSYLLRSISNAIMAELPQDTHVQFTTGYTLKTSCRQLLTNFSNMWTPAKCRADLRVTFAWQEAWCYQPLFSSPVQPSKGSTRISYSGRSPCSNTSHCSTNPWRGCHRGEGEHWGFPGGVGQWSCRGERGQRGCQQVGKRSQRHHRERDQSFGVCFAYVLPVALHSRQHYR